MKHKQEKTKFSEADLKAFLKNLAERYIYMYVCMYKFFLVSIRSGISLTNGFTMYVVIVIQ